MRQPFFAFIYNVISYKNRQKNNFDDQTENDKIIKCGIVITWVIFGTTLSCQGSRVKPPGLTKKWYRPKMAASVWKRCVTAAVKVKCLSPSILGKSILHLRWNNGFVFMQFCFVTSIYLASLIVIWTPCQLRLNVPNSCYQLAVF